jgi:quinolinate synthase
MAKSNPESDCHVYVHPLSYDIVTSKVYYTNSTKLKIKHIEDLKQYRMKFKTELQYWYYVINYIKETVLIQLPNLRLAKIYINTLDKNNVIHQFIISVGEFIGNILKMPFIMNQMIFIYIQYGHDIKFIGNV